jgi:hypothetical protein
MCDDPGVRPLKHLVLSSALLTAVALAAALAVSASAAAPLKIANCNSAASRPKLLTLTCGDGNTVLKGLSWSSFGGKSAQAKGTFVMNTCEPDCAAGKDVSYPVKATASGSLTCKRGERVYAKLTLQFTGRVPGAGVPRSWKLGCPI